MKVQHVELGQLLEVLDFLDIVLTEHEDSEGGDRVKVVDVLYVVIIEVQEDKVGEGHQVLNFGY